MIKGIPYKERCNYKRKHVRHFRKILFLIFAMLVTVEAAKASAVASKLLGGNINTKYNVGTYQYANNSHAVSGISSPVSGYSYPNYTLNNTSYDRPLSLTLPSKKLDFQYDAYNQRKKTQYYENNALVKTMYYAGNYEKEVIEGGATNEYDYIYSPEGLAAIAIKTNGARTLYYAHVDHLGSLRVVTTAAKAIQTRYHYDAWGYRTLDIGTSITNRGFTGYEHLP